MASSDKSSTDYGKPVAYSADGQPLYAHPPKGDSIPETHEKQVDITSHVTAAPNEPHSSGYDPQMRVQYANEPSIVHATRPLVPKPIEINNEAKRKHEESVKRYPNLNLSEYEYVILAVRRHIIGLLGPVVFTGMTIVLLLTVLLSYPLIVDPESTSISFGLLAVIILPLCLLVGLFGYIAVWVYLQNRFYMTNESVIQEIQTTVFSRHEQTVSLGSIEDASYKQTGIMQTLFDYGTIRLSTEGEETTYVFHFVSQPKQQITILTNAIESFKNGRPVVDEAID